VTATATATPAAQAHTSARRSAAVQSRINGELAVRLGDGIAAATVSFGLGLLVLVALVPGTRAGRRGLAALRGALRGGTLRPWQCLGGTCGGFLVATQGLTVATLGVAVFMVALVAGQSASGLAVDRAGAAPGGRHPLTAPRAVGAVLTVVAVLLSVADRLGHPRALAVAALPLVAGIGIAWQQAVNGHVRVASDSALVAGFLNFATGTAALSLALLVDLLLRGLPDRPPAGWWLYLGGPLGIVFIVLGAAVVRYTGVLLLGLGMIAGQVTGAVALDVLAPAAAGRPSWTTLAGAALTVVAVFIAVLPGRRASSGSGAG
jgi:bacterial/archaeal transporter family-2 protein